MARSYFKRQALKVLSFIRNTWIWFTWIVCRLSVILSITLFPYPFLVHLLYENVSQYSYAQESNGNSLAPVPRLVCFMKIIAATTYWAFTMYWASTECWFSGIINSSSLCLPNRGRCYIINGGGWWEKETLKMTPDFWMNRGAIPWDGDTRKRTLFSLGWLL